MSSCKSNYKPSQPQLLSPKFFEQPPKLLPPSIFRQACCELEAAADDEHGGSGSAVDGSTSKSFQFQHEVACDREGALAQSQTFGNHSEPTRKLRPADINETPVKSKKYIQQHHSQSISRKRRLYPAEPKTDQETFNAKYDNQLLLVAENVSYTLAAKQRWKESDHLAVLSRTTASGVKKLDKVLQYTAIGARASSSTKGQLALALVDRPKVDTPTCFVSASIPSASFSETTISTSTKTVSCPYSADSKPTKQPVTESVTLKKGLRESHDIGVNVPTDSKSSKASFIVKDRTRCLRTTHEPQVTVSYSFPVCSVVPGADRSTRINEVDRGFAGEQCTADNLRPRHEKSPPTELNTSSQKPKVPRYHTDLKTKASHPPVGVGNSTSSVIRMATAIDTESDLVLAQVLQSEEYEASGKHVVRKEERTKPQRVAADCSSDFEIALRLQQEMDAESAQSMQSQEDHHHDYRRMPGLGRKLGSGDATRRNVREDVKGYYDNNNQYHYTIRENFTEHPGASVGYGGGVSGTSLHRLHHHYRGATAATFSGEEIDMSYETLVELEDVSRGLDKATISRLSNIYKYNPSSSMEKSCLVCLSEFESGETLRSLPCIHAFHESCIDKWLTDNRQCPVCMKDIDTMQS